MLSTGGASHVRVLRQQGSIITPTTISQHCKRANRSLCVYAAAHSAPVGGVRARWCLDVRYGRKQEATALLQVWFHNDVHMGLQARMQAGMHARRSTATVCLNTGASVKRYTNVELPRLPNTDPTGLGQDHREQGGPECQQHSHQRWGNWRA